MTLKQQKHPRRGSSFKIFKAEEEKDKAQVAMKEAEEAKNQVEAQMDAVKEAKKVAEEEKAMSQGINNAVVVEISATTTKIAEKVWKDYAKQFKGKTKK